MTFDPAIGGVKEEMDDRAKHGWGLSLTTRKVSDGICVFVK
jgi:hypothetical protein